MSDLRKVTFALEDNAWHGFETEALWAEHVGGDCYKLDNSPLLARGVSYRDVVRAVARDGTLRFDAVERPSGHSTYRVILKSGHTHAEFEAAWPPFLAGGCTYENGTFLDLPIYAIDVPPTADIFVLRGGSGKLDKGDKWMIRVRSA